MAALLLMQTAADDAGPVTWDVPAGCPSEAALQGEVRRLLGGAEPDLSMVRVQGRITPTAAGYSLRLVVQTPDGSTERRLDAPACDPLVDSAALYVAMAVDAVATVAKAQEPPPAPPPDEARAPVVPPALPAAPVRERAFDLRASGGATLGGYAQPGGVGALHGSLLLGSVRLELGGVFAGWRPLAVGADGPAASVFAIGGELRACPAFRRDAVELFGCGGLHVGMHRAKGTSVDRSEVARSFTVDALVGTGLVWWPASRVGLWLEPDMVVGLYRPRFVVEGAQGSLTPTAVSARVTLGIAVRVAGWTAGERRRD